MGKSIDLTESPAAEPMEVDTTPVEKVEETSKPVEEVSEPTIEDQPAETKKETKKEAKKVEKEDSAEGSEKEDGSDEDEVYVVEAIVSHKKDKNGYLYNIKWQGFSDEDNTWETEDNIFDTELLEAYWKKQPKGKETTPKQPASKKRKTKKDEDASVEVIVLDHQYPPEDLEDWESECSKVETVERTKAGILMVYLLWKNGSHTAHPASIANVKCPQKVIEFYQNHLKFSE